MKIDDLGQAGKIVNLFFFSFALFGLSVGWVVPVHIGKGIILTLTFKCYSPLELPTAIPRNNTLPVIWAFLSPQKLMYQIN